MTTIRLLSIALLTLTSAVSATSFRKATPHWPDTGGDDLNSRVGFRTVLEAPPADAVLRIATSGLYRATIDGKFLGHGPARGGHGHFRIDQWTLKGLLDAKVSVIGIEVAASEARSYYMVKQPAFLQAEIVSGGKVLATTKDFQAVDLHPAVLRKVPRYSYQRTFSEVFRPQQGWLAWRKEVKWDGPSMPLTERPAVSLDERGVPYPQFAIIESKSIADGSFEVLDLIPKRTYYGFQPKDFGDFPESELEARPDRLMTSLKTTSLKEHPPGDDGSYQGDHISNWAMWFVFELEEYLARTGDRALARRLQPRVEALMKYFTRFENSDGLLEKLDGWIFVEWSKANEFVRDVNYPTNMLYASALVSAGRIYQNESWRGKASAMRETINRQSFDGTFYRDHANRLPDGTLDIRPERTEVCQYYAFFCGTTTPEQRPELWKTLVEEFGPSRRETKAHPEIFPCNQLPGNMLRIEILSRYRKTARIHDEALGYWQMMSETTGTLRNNPMITGVFF